MPLGFVGASGAPGDQLETTFIREGIKPVICHDDVIQDSHIEQQAAIFDFLGNSIVGLTRLGIATRMVVALM